MFFRGWQKQSLIEWPGKISTVVFMSGCNFSCPWCYNRDLVLNSEHLPKIFEEEVLEHLNKNKDFLDALVVTGGEPTLCSNSGDLLLFFEKIKRAGFLAGLETNGTHPKFIEKLLKNKLVDYLAMDIKAPLNHEKYNQLVGVEINPHTKFDRSRLSSDDSFVNLKSKIPNHILTNYGVGVNLENIKKSIQLIKDSDIDYEFRTTVVTGLLTVDDISEIAQEIKGARRYVLQKFHSENSLLAEDKISKNVQELDLSALAREIDPLVKCLIRA
ncbi:MAG: anaerobic ribonucleoside-triphosphate reductase activating protein [Patescibacteria group bacterium]